MLANLQNTLVQTLEALKQEMLLVSPDPGSLRDLVFRGLPAPDLRPWGETLRWSRPWWTSFLPHPAVWLTRQGMARKLGPTLKEQVGLHDRQLQTWMTGCLAQLVELFEDQAEVVREQVRRLAPRGNGAAGDTPGGADIDADLCLLKEAIGVQANQTPDHSGRV